MKPRLLLVEDDRKLAPLVGDSSRTTISRWNGRRTATTAGARGLRLTADGERIAVEEIWSTRRVQLYHVSAVRIGDWVYGSTGTATAFLTATNVRTGEIAWRERGFAKANCVEADLG